MDAKSYIQIEFAGARQLIDAAIGGTTDEQFNWQPPGLANSIKASFIHLVVSEDFFIQQIIQGQPQIWAVGGWAEKTGLPFPPGGGRGWEEIKSATLALAPVLAYQQAVRAATDAYLATLTPEELDRSISLFGNPAPVASALTLVVSHMVGHAGEIAALKGVQGVMGLPF